MKLKTYSKGVEKLLILLRRTFRVTPKWFLRLRLFVSKPENPKAAGPEKRHFQCSSYSKGLSLIEILISIVMIMLIIMAFAMVFPSGMRLNATNLRANRATEIANGVIEEIKNMPLCSLPPGLCPPNFNSSGNMKSLECLIDPTTGNFKGTPYWRPSTLPQDNFYQIGGLVIAFYSSQSTIGPGLAIPCDPLSNYNVSVTATITWTDTKTNTPRNLTTRSLFNTNR